MSRELLRPGDLVETLGVSRGQIYNLIAAGVIPSVVLGPRSIRIPRAAFEHWLEEQNRKAEEAVGAGRPR